MPARATKINELEDTAEVSESSKIGLMNALFLRPSFLDKNNNSSTIAINLAFVGSPLTDGEPSEKIPT